MRLSLNLKNVLNAPLWRDKNIELPVYDIEKARQNTTENPAWLHFGSGNIFRGFIASLADSLLNGGFSDTGVIAAETYDTEIIERIYAPYDNLALNVILKPDGGCAVSVNASVAQALTPQNDKERLINIVCKKSLRLITYTITEKGYSLKNSDFSDEDNIICLTVFLLHRRFLAGGAPIALVSLDNCSRNGDKLRKACMQTALSFKEKGVAQTPFLEWLSSSENVSFPLTMIDKITPQPSDAVRAALEQSGFINIEPIKTKKQTFIAPYVNAEEAQHLIIEDNFPAGRPPLEKAGVLFTNKECVHKAERMKVTALLNPLHTAAAAFGALLRKKTIADCMDDPDVFALVNRLGYTETLPIVSNPEIISPKAFLDECVKRLKNPYIPDAPQRIMIDTSQKMPVRFGETIKTYIETNRDLSALTALPLAIAAWFRYLLGADDFGRALELSYDPENEALTRVLKYIKWNDPKSYEGQLSDILKNTALFGCDLRKTPLFPIIEKMFVGMLTGKDAVRGTLQTYLGTVNK